MPPESLDTTDPLGTALELHRLSLRLVPLDGKRALLKDWPSLHLSEREICSWGRRGVNWGIVTGEPLVVLDTDTEEAEAWVREKGIDSPSMVRSGGRGLHRYFRCRAGEQVRGKIAALGIRGLDVKGWHGYIVAAGSIHPDTGRRYAYLPGRELTALETLPLFDVSWVEPIRVEPWPKPRPPSRVGSVGNRIRDVRAYVRAIRSIEGSGGDRSCFTVACLLAEAGLSFEEALAELLIWNATNALPPWAPPDLHRKLRYAFARVLGEC
jgi:hypothetical protein